MGYKISTVIKFRKISIVWLIAAVVIFSIGLSYQKWLVFIIGVISIIVYCVSAAIFWRCPYCNKRLSMRIHYKTYNDIDNTYVCPYCNKDFKG